MSIFNVDRMLTALVEYSIKTSDVEDLKSIRKEIMAIGDDDMSQHLEEISSRIDEMTIGGVPKIEAKIEVLSDSSSEEYCDEDDSSFASMESHSDESSDDDSSSQDSN